MTAPVIIWDIDDVWHPWMDLSHQACIDARAILLGTPVPKTWTPYNEYGIPLETWVEALDAATQSGGLYDSTPSDEDMVAFYKLTRLGATHHFVTARGFLGAQADLVRQHTVEWVARHFGDLADSLTFSTDKGADAVRLGGTHAIDDSHKNWELMHAAGVETYLMDKPWNQDFTVPADRRVHSISEFAAAIEKGITA